MSRPRAEAWLLRLAAWSSPRAAESDALVVASVPRGSPVAVLPVAVLPAESPIPVLPLAVPVAVLPLVRPVVALPVALPAAAMVPTISTRWPTYRDRSAAWLPVKVYDIGALEAPVRPPVVALAVALRSALRFALSALPLVAALPGSALPVPAPSARVVDPA